MMELYNGEILGFSMSKRSTLDFVIDSLKQVLPIIQGHAQYRTMIHSDQGWHYQHHLWVITLKRNRVFQSMSRKATCADNAAMENFFGLLKQEMYYGEELVSYEALKEKIEKYIDYYNIERIKQKLVGMSPVKIPNSCQPISCITKTLTLRGHYQIRLFFTYFSDYKLLQLLHDHWLLFAKVLYSKDISNL